MTSTMTITSEVHNFFIAQLPRVVSGARRLYGSFSRRSHSSIERLPNELLVSIFQMVVQGKHDWWHATLSPLTVSHVCCRWRHLALMTGSLWASLNLTYPASAPQLSRTATWLYRSRSYPLDIFLDFRDPFWDWQELSHSFGWQEMEGMMRILLVHVQRWRSFELLVDTWSPIFTFLWYTRRVQSAPLLETLSLSRCNAYLASKGQIFQPAALRQPMPLFGGLLFDRLQDVFLVGVHLDWSNSSLRNLSELELKYHASDVMPSLAEFKGILLGCPSLRGLTIMGWGPQFDVLPGNPIPDAYRSIFQHQRSILLPVLERFSLGIIDTDYAVDLLSLFCLPSLSELALEDVSKTLDLLDSLDATPILEWLSSSHELSCPSPSHTPVISYPLRQVNSLKLRGITSDNAILIRFLCQFEGLTRLGLFDITNSAIHALGVDNTPVLCPNLTELECEDINLDVLVDFLQSRASRMPLPLSTLSLDFIRTTAPPKITDLKKIFSKIGIHKINVGPTP